MTVIDAKVAASQSNQLRQRLLRNMGWSGLSEVAVRITRVATTVVLARLLAPMELGVAATVLTCFELIRVLVNNGIGQAIIRAPAAALEATCATAYRLAWCLCIGVAAIQLLVAAILAVSLAPGVGLMLAVLSGVYLFMAPGLVNVYLILRANRIRTTAAIATSQMVADNLLTLLFAVLGIGAWAIVLPKLLVAPIWLGGVRRAHVWRFDPAVAGIRMNELLRFALPVLGSEVLATARFNLDNLLVLLILGVKALGTYYFVFNIGVGFCLSLTGMIATVLFPHLAESAAHAPGTVARFDRAMLTVVLPATFLIAAQTLACLFYVPLIFGERWAYAAPLVAVLCASVITKPASDAAGQLLRALGFARIELTAQLIGTPIYLGAFAAALPFGLFAAIVTLSLTATVLQLAFAAYARLTAARACAEAA